MDLYELSRDNVVAIIGDNVSANKFLSVITKKPFIGCASHRFNLTVCNILRNEEKNITKFHAIIKK